MVVISATWKLSCRIHYLSQQTQLGPENRSLPLVSYRYMTGQAYLADLTTTYASLATA